MTTILPEPGDPAGFFILDLYGMVWRYASGGGRRGTTNFVRWMTRFLHSEHPAHLVAADDFGGQTWRHERYPAYKADRKAPTDEEAAILKRVRGEITEFVEDLGIPIFSAQGYEADDVIATVTRWAWRHQGPLGRRVVIVGRDRDLLQLVTSNGVMMWDGGDKMTGVEECVAEVGVPPSKIPDYFALVGGKNNLPGVQKIGHKAATRLLACGDLAYLLDALPHNPSEADCCAVGLSLREGRLLTAGRELAVLGLELARLRPNVPLDVERLAREAPCAVLP